MFRFLLIVCTVVAIVVYAGCSQDQPLTPDQSVATNDGSAVTVDPEAVAAELVSLAGWELDPDAADSKTGGIARTEGACVDWFEREVIVDDIVHYYAEIQVGPGPYDKIGLHRVVRERRPNQPIHTKKSLFLQHGALVGFAKFIFGSTSPSTSDDHSVAVYLAQHDVDVWGIDQNWVLVPADIPDFSFMSTWGLQNQIDNLNLGLAAAHMTRTMTGSGAGKMLLLGYSAGVATGYGYLNEETQRPFGLRHVAGYIAVEQVFKAPGLEPLACQLAAATLDLINQGIYQDATGQLMNTLGMLAQADPNGASPVMPGLTNLQAALSLGTTHQAVGGHFFAGIFENDVPSGLQYTAVSGYLDFLLSASPYWPIPFLYDIQRTACENPDVPFDDHLGEITVPVLSFSAAGGYSWLTHLTLGYIGSTDVTIHDVQLHPSEEVALDFGHVDLWTAENAPVLVWQPILDWINAHVPVGRTFAKNIDN
jgi:hypothetical protein